MPMLAVNGETIHYEQIGSGPAVVLLHSLGTSGRMWTRQIAALEDRYCVITLDCRGHGQSSANGEMNFAAAAQDLRAVLDHLGCKACHLTGLGMGGAVALHLNVQSPAMVRSIVFADFAAKPAENSSDTVIARREAIAYISMPEFATQYAAEHLMFTTPLDVQDEVAAMIAGMSQRPICKRCSRLCSRTLAHWSTRSKRQRWCWSVKTTWSSPDQWPKRLRKASVVQRWRLFRPHPT